MDFQISGPEADLLREILARHLGELRVEVNHTERLEGRRELQGTEQTIKNLIARLDRSAAVVAAR